MKNDNYVYFSAHERANICDYESVKWLAGKHYMAVLNIVSDLQTDLLTEEKISTETRTFYALRAYEAITAFLSLNTTLSAIYIHYIADEMKKAF